MNRAHRPLDRHIANVAAELFYRHGIHNVGVDRVALSAEVTKRTLYRYFPSKDVLIAAALRYSPKVRLPADGTPAEQIIGAFRAVADFLRDSEYRGCPYVVAAAELTDANHPARHIVREHIAARKRWFTDRAREAGAAAPELLGEQLNVLFDGVLGNGAKVGPSSAADAAITAAAVLLAHSLGASLGAVRAARDLETPRSRRSFPPSR
jgi:AcrR family transcriptional regulator